MANQTGQQPKETPETSEAERAWHDAVLAAALFAIDPVLSGGIVVKARSGPVRDRWFDALKQFLLADRPIRRIPAHADVSRLLGGLDLAATLGAGRPVADRGLLAEADGGVIVLPNAERAERQSIAHIAAAFDRGFVALERDGFQLQTPASFGVIAFDEGANPEEETSSVLADRLSFRVAFDAVSIRNAALPEDYAAKVVAARGLMSSVSVDGTLISDVCAVAMAFGIGSLRTSLQAVAVARAAAAFGGRTSVTSEDANTAVRLVLGPKARQIPELQDDPGQRAEDDQAPPPEPNKADDATPDTEPDGSEDRLVNADTAAIPPDLLRLLASQGGVKCPTGSGRAGVRQRSKNRGRRAGSQPGELNSGVRVDLAATLRAAAPWQALRRRQSKRHDRLEIRREDIRIMRFKTPAETATIFVVDASGSSALHRLGEAKGAIELMLADCYARRDSVALISFRGKKADVLLTPTRSLVRAKRNLAALPGGGGTPLASAIDAASELGGSVRRRGQSPVVVFLTDGRANVARDGSGSRAKGLDEAHQAARGFRTSGLNALLIDTSPQPKPEALEIANAMGARYLPLPHAGAEAISHAVRRNRTALG